jgi:hypothetical protein
MRRAKLVMLALVLGMLAVPAAASAQGQWWETTPEVNKDLPPGLTPYHDVAPKLRDIARRSNRVQVEVIGQSAQGRDLYLVTVSEPSAHGRFGRYKALRNLMLRDPARAQERAAEFEDFKVPVFVNGSIHGNEWEGVDASLALIERLAFSNDSETRQVLENTIVLFNVVQNPDGRVLGQRANGNGFDLNRDFITLSQPESRATVRRLVEWHPMVFLDLHGYVDPYLIEPATPPHNPNYEYDLYIKWALAQAQTMEAALDTQMGLDAVIPFRDWADGWDDWPPIFTPMYAMYHGAYGHTMEAPMRVNNNSVSLPAEERRRRAAINKQAHETTVWAALKYASQNRRAMVHDQIEIFRRGFLDEPQVPIGDEYGEQHEFLAQFPEAYVIPVGEGQRSDPAAVELVNHLLANDVEVRRATGAFTAGGVSYEAGSYIVPMAQPKRGLANTILEPGYDITDVVPVMYDISGWSLGELWGATRVAVPDGQPLTVNSAPVSREQRPDGAVDAGAAAAYALRVDTPAAVRAVNELLDAGVDLQRTADGRVFVPASARTRLQRLASERGLDFAAAAVPASAETLEDVRIAAAASADELFVLRELGFEVDPVTTAAVNGGAQLDAYDVVYISTSGLRYATLNAAGKAEVADLLADGGIVGRGSQGGRFNFEAGLLAVTTVAGDIDANGIGHVDNAAGSPVASTAPEETFVYSPVWFTGVGPGVQVAQRFEGGDFFFSGHWIGQESAAGQAVVVHGEAGDGRVALFGSNPLFRAHPRGLFAQVAHAAWWSGSDS